MSRFIVAVCRAQSQCAGWACRTPPRSTHGWLSPFAPRSRPVRARKNYRLLTKLRMALITFPDSSFNSIAASTPVATASANAAFMN